VRIVRPVVPVLAALVFALAGCGGDDDGDEEAGQTGTTTAQTDTETGRTDTGAEESAGAAVWASTGCGVCHTLEAAGSTGTTGPNLDEVQPSEEQVATQVREGGGGMPSFEDRLSAEEIDAVAQYVSESAGG
jgi:mono/diheme cytochrome c family protein